MLAVFLRGTETRRPGFYAIAAFLMSALSTIGIVRAESDARELIRASILTMGGPAPATSDVTAAIAIVEGSTTRTGTVRIRTNGLTATREDISARTVEVRTYNDGFAAERRGGETRTACLTLAQGLVAAHFPLVLLEGILTDPDTIYEYVGVDTVDSRSTHHLRVRKSYAARGDLESLSEVSEKDIWIDSGTLLPARVMFKRHEGQGAVYAVPIEYTYSAFRLVSGKAFPFRIEQSLNGTPWATITNPVVTLNPPISGDVFAIN